MWGTDRLQHSPVLKSRTVKGMASPTVVWWAVFIMITDHGLAKREGKGSSG